MKTNLLHLDDITNLSHMNDKTNLSFLRWWPLKMMYRCMKCDMHRWYVQGMYRRYVQVVCINMYKWIFVLGFSHRNLFKGFFCEKVVQKIWFFLVHSKLCSKLKCTIFAPVLFPVYFFAYLLGAQHISIKNT